MTQYKHVEVVKIEKQQNNMQPSLQSLFFVIYRFLHKIILHKVKNILWKCNISLIWPE